jgi:hypothetical protein
LKDISLFGKVIPSGKPRTARATAISVVFGRKNPRPPLWYDNINF